MTIEHLRQLHQQVEQGVKPAWALHDVFPHLLDIAEAALELTHGGQHLTAEADIRDEERVYERLRELTASLEET